MMNLDYSNKWDKKCPQIQCRKDPCTGLQYVFIPATMGDDTKESPVAPKNGAYCNSIVLYEATKAVYIYSKEGIPTKTSNGGYTFFNDIIDRPFYDNNMMTSSTSIPKVPDAVSELTNDLNYQTKNDVDAAILVETTARELADQTLQGEIDTIVASSDVKDIVGTYAELEAYDTSTLGNNDIIKVLQDETHNDAETYYRWSTSTETFTYIGELGPFYTKSETNTLLSGKQDTLTAGENINITGNTISAVMDDGIYRVTRTYLYVDGVNGSDSNTGISPSAPFKTLDKAISRINNIGGSVDIRFMSAGTYDLTGGVLDSANIVFEKYPSTLGDTTINVKTRSLTVDNSALQFTNFIITCADNGVPNYDRTLSAVNSQVLFSPADCSLNVTLQGSSLYTSSGSTLRNALTANYGSSVSLNGTTLKYEKVITANANFVSINNSSRINIIGQTTVEESAYNSYLTMFAISNGDLKVAQTATFVSNATTKPRRFFYTEKASAYILDSQVTSSNALATNTSSFGSGTVRVAGNVTLPYAAGQNISISGSTISSKAQTIFYMNSSESGSTRHIYKKSDMTDPATSQEVFDANDLGQVILRISTSVDPASYSDAYLQNAYKATGDYQLLFLDEKTYRSFDVTDLSSSTFTYSSRVIQDQIVAGEGIAITNNVVSADFKDAWTRQTYYIDGTNGSDSNPGTNASPFKTLGKALSKCNSVGSNFSFQFKTAGTYSWPSNYFNFSGKNIGLSVASGVTGVIITLSGNLIVSNSVFNINGGAADGITFATNSAGTMRSINLYASEVETSYTYFDELRVQVMGSTFRCQNGGVYSVYSRGGNVRLNVVTVYGDFSTDAMIRATEGSDLELGNITAAQRSEASSNPFVKVETGSKLSVDGALTNNLSSSASYTYGINANNSIIQEVSGYVAQYEAIGGGINVANSTLHIKNDTVVAGNENFTFTMVDNTVVTKNIVLGA